MTPSATPPTRCAPRAKSEREGQNRYETQRGTGKVNIDPSAPTPTRSSARFQRRGPKVSVPRWVVCLEPLTPLIIRLGGP